ncbi:MAG: ABC transporter ATP-binding protein [Clostridiales bacterium]|nr:ABC transporter ATP-binding protein [Clostridiales bacterium]
MQRNNNRPGGPMGGGHMGRVEKAKNFKGTLRKLMNYMGRYRWSMLVVILLAAGSSVFSVIGPKRMGQITTEIFTGLMRKISGGPGINFGAIGHLLLWLLGLYGISAFLSFLQGYIMSSVSQKVSYDLRMQLAAKVHRLPMQYFDHTTTGEVLSRVTNDVDTLGQALNQSMTQIVSSTATAVGVLVMMLTISWKMTLVALAIVPLSSYLMGFVVKRSQKYFVGQQKLLGQVNGQVEEVFSGHVVVKAFNAQESMTRIFDRTNKELFDSARKSQFYSGLIHPIMNFIGNLGYVAMVVLGGYYATQGVIAVGDIQSFNQYVRSFNQPIAQIAQIAGIIQSAMAASERVFEFLEEPEETPVVANPVSISGVRGQVTFDHVRFGYNASQPVIRDFNAIIQPGQKVAIVGPTGSGKTTMVKLLMRFYDVDSGSIKVDGHDLREFDRDELRKLYGMVLQETWLFGGSIMENIRYGRLGATDDEVVQAARSAHANHFIRALPGGYHMKLNEESSNISQGQKQLLTIARAILADPKIMILDEATSSVDTRTEILIQKAMAELMRDRTSFVIAHRLSTIRDADWILVMQDGDIVEQGKHEELLHRSGFYAKLYKAQFERTA